MNPDFKRRALLLLGVSDGRRPSRQGPLSYFQVTVTITSEGRWTVQMIAQQHPGELVEAQLRPQFELYRRNLFRVDLRPVGLMTVEHTEATASIGKPEFLCIPTQQFWIQKDQTQRIQQHGRSTELARNFNVIRQVEIHFSYR